MYENQMMRQTWTAPPHLQIVDGAIVEAVKQSNGRLIFTGPVRHGKSRQFTHYTPAWFLGNNPTKKVIVTSYEATFAAGWGEMARDTMRRVGPEVFGVTVGGRDAMNWWTVRRAGEPWDAGGTMWTAGIGGPIEGKGGDLIVVDDPFKNEEEAESPTIRDKRWRWFLSVLMSRAEPGCTVLITMHRWHDDDFVGRIVEQMKAETGEHWRIINLPALAEAPVPDYDWRKPGEPLWPERFDRDRLLRIKRAIGGYYWNAIWQGHPSPPEGDIVQRGWWRYWDELPRDMDEWIQSWDLKFKDVETRSFVVGQLWGRKGANKYLVDQRREHLGFTDTIRAIRAFTKRHPMTLEILVEERANGAAVINTLRDEISGLIPWNPEGSKPARARAVSPLIESGNVYLPSPRIPGMDWVEDYLEEWAHFPHGIYSDQVDATSQALQRLKESERDLFATAD
jgi:predicted phage terminase large subunit-like protein